MSEKKMRLGRGVFAALVLSLLGAATAQAETISLLSETGVINGSQSYVYSLNAARAGTFTIQLENIDWPQKLANLTFAATTATSVLAKLEEAGTLSFDVGAAGVYYALVSGTAQASGVFNMGLFSLRADFTPAAPIPLPAGVWLLLSGVGMLAGARRRRADAAGTAQAV